MWACRAIQRSRGMRRALPSPLTGWNLSAGREGATCLIIHREHGSGRSWALWGFWHSQAKSLREQGTSWQLTSESFHCTGTIPEQSRAITGSTQTVMALVCQINLFRKVEKKSSWGGLGECLESSLASLNWTCSTGAGEHTNCHERHCLCFWGKVQPLAS